jgi:hypothetical protein
MSRSAIPTFLESGVDAIHIGRYIVWVESLNVSMLECGNVSIVVLLVSLAGVCHSYVGVVCGVVCGVCVCVCVCVCV